MFMMGMELEDTSISFLGCPYSAWLRRGKRNSLFRYFFNLVKGRRGKAGLGEVKAMSLV